MPRTRVQLTDNQRRSLLDPANLPHRISVAGREYTPETPVAAGFKGAVWRVRDHFSRLRALKLCICADYEDRSYLQEAHRIAQLSDHHQFARLEDAGMVELSLGDAPPQHFVAFVEEWVDGITLARCLADSPDTVSASFLLAYAKGFANALSILQAASLRHDDLHADNVMIARPARGVLDSEWSVKIIDTGSLKDASVPTRKSKDDHRHFVEHLVLIWNAVHARKMLAPRDRRFLKRVASRLQSMLDDDPTMALRDPAQIAEHFHREYTRAVAPERKQLTPASPFEFLSAEHIADDKLLVDIFAESCPFLHKVASRDPCLVTGPRGCGKSTIFRWLSLKAHLHKAEPEAHQFEIAGFYISCSSDLQNKLGWMKTEALATRFRAEIIHYFNLLFAREVAQTLATIAERTDRETLWGFGTEEEKVVWDFLSHSLERRSPTRLQGVPRLFQALHMIEEELFFTHSQMERRRSMAGCTGQAFLATLSALLVKHLAYFQEKRITFLVDDYSVHRIPRAVQTVLNQVIWERLPSHIFKLSSEKYGAHLTDAFGATVDVTREMLEIDCGREYIALDSPSRVRQLKRFATDLLDKRLRAAEYRGRAKTLIGNSTWQEGSLGHALAMKRRGRVLDQYHGIDCIAQVCSGDVATLLLVYRRILELGKVTRESTGRIRKTTQHEAIVSVSRSLHEATKHHVPFGPDLYAVVDAFGQLASRILRDGRWQKTGKRTTPSQCPRIELDQRDGDAVEALARDQKELARELVRRAIFIEMEPGLSRHRHATTLRWHLRRVYLPGFGAALAKNNAVKQSAEWLRYFLTQPTQACDLVWDTWARPVSPRLFKK